jgi:hypothetical protein
VAAATTPAEKTKLIFVSEAAIVQPAPAPATS